MEKGSGFHSKKLFLKYELPFRQKKN